MPSRSTRVVEFQSAGAVTGSSNSDEYQVEGFAEGVIFVDITAVSGTNPVMTVILQGRSDGDSWMSYLSRRFTAITTAAIRVSNFAKNVRIRLVLEGTSPSFTTEIDGVFKN